MSAVRDSSGHGWGGAGHPGGDGRADEGAARPPLAGSGRLEPPGCRLADSLRTEHHAQLKEILRAVGCCDGREEGNAARNNVPQPPEGMDGMTTFHVISSVSRVSSLNKLTSTMCDSFGLECQGGDHDSAEEDRTNGIILAVSKTDRAQKGLPVESRDIRYTVHARILRDEWTVSIHPADIESPEKSSPAVRKRSCLVKYMHHRQVA